jgi:hypothetical protein
VQSAATSRLVPPGTRLGLIATVIGVLSAVISVGRLWLFDRSAPTEVLWAEDGLFPLCIHKADFLACLTDPFAGYFLFLPRVVAWPISWLPWEWWALATNVAAAVIAGVVSALAVVILRRFGLHWVVVIVVALLPVIAPVTGLEAINAVGSSYMLLLFLATLLVAFPPADGMSPVAVALGAVLMLVTALTIPSAVVLLMLIGIMVLRRALSVHVGAVWSVALVLGLVVQAVVALGAEARRPISFGAETLTLWADSIPISIFTYWPGLSLGEYTFFSNFTLSPLGITGWLMAATLLVGGVVLTIRHRGRLLAVGVMLLGGLGFGFIPSAIGYANNRYFVVPLLLWGAALLVALDPVIARTRWWILAIVGGVVVVLWSPAFPASSFRATPAPPWGAEVARVEAACKADPEFIDRPIFTPFWPPELG